MNQHSRVGARRCALERDAGGGAGH